MKSMKSRVWAARVLDRRGQYVLPLLTGPVSPVIWVNIANPIWQAIFQVDEQ